MVYSEAELKEVYNMATAKLVAVGAWGYEAWHVQGQAFEKTPQGDWIRKEWKHDPSQFRCENGSLLTISESGEWVEVEE